MFRLPWRGKSREMETRRSHPLERFRQEFDDLFDRMWFGSFAPMELEFEQERLWDFDVRQDDKEIVVRAEMPGFDEKDLDVQFNNDVLTINAEKRQEEGGERHFSRFARSVTLPAGVDATKAQATYRNGVLELHFPRPEGARGRRIPIQGAQAALGTTASAAPAKGEGKQGNGHAAAPGKAAEKAKA
jgi:HSP20 family protein